MPRKAAVLVVLVLVAGLLIVFAVRLPSVRNAVPSAFGREVIRIGYAIEAPYAFVTSTGEVTGESPELAREVIRRLGVKRTVWVQTSFPDLLDELESGRFDVIAAGLIINAERARRVLFSVPTCRVRPGLLVRTGNPLRLHAYADLVRTSDARVAVLPGAIEEQMLLEAGFPRVRLLPVPDARTGRVAVVAGNADGLALSAPAIGWMVREEGSSSLEIADPFESSSEQARGRRVFGAFAFRRSDERLRDAWNAVLRSFIGSDEHLRLVRPFGFTRDEMPGPVSGSEVVGR